MHRWSLQDAKAKFSEMVREAQADGPQEITLRGEPVAVVLSSEEYRRLVSPASASSTSSAPPR
jgi:prevent-host-death family protein